MNERSRTPGEGEILALVETALRRRRVLWIRYVVTSRNDEVTEREIELQGYDREYLLGFCRLRQATRTFRVDRVLALALRTERYALRPAVLEEPGDRLIEGRWSGRNSVAAGPRACYIPWME